MENQNKIPNLLFLLSDIQAFCNYGIKEILIVKEPLHFVYPSGKPMIPHLLRCQGLAVVYYDFALGRLESGAPSTFAQLGLYKISQKRDENSGLNQANALGRSEYGS